jgi:hypothetical protein
MTEQPLINRVANSGLITLNLEEDFPAQEMVTIDLKEYLFQGLILKEKEFRTALKEIDWSQFQDKVVLVYCSSDAIIPVWAFMLISSLATQYAFDVFHGTKDEYLRYYYKNLIGSRSFKEFEGKRIVIKGCSKQPVPTTAYLELTSALQPYAQSIMYGEPCSTVPIFKRPRKLRK